MASKTVLLVYLVAILIAKNRVDAVIGVNWGRESAQRLIPSTVVDLLLQNGVKEARVFTARKDLLQAFAGSGIGLSLTVNNIDDIQSHEQCIHWISQKMTFLGVSSVRRVHLGTDVGNDPTALSKSMMAMETLQRALNETGWASIKVVLTHSVDVLKPNITKPSEAEFLDEMKEVMKAHLLFLRQNDAPFVISYVPPFFIEKYNLCPSFAFVGESNQVIKDINAAVYDNLFTFIHDSFVWAFRKLEVPDVKILVGQVGWPTDGYRRGNASVTERFFKGLLPYVASNRGTPLRRGAPIDTFVHALTDENQLPTRFMRHWGIYRSNGKPKFKIDLTGQGRDIYPTSAKGIMRMPRRWCVFNGNKMDYSKVMRQLEFAYRNSDCSSVVEGGQCSGVEFDKHMSYAFNMYFQFRYQHENACDFGGLAYITSEDPSTQDCEFPVEVVRGKQEDYVPMGAVVYDQNAKGFHTTPNCILPLFLLSILGALFWK